MNDFDWFIPAWLRAIRTLPIASKAVTAAGKGKHAAGRKKQKPATYTKQRQQKRQATKATWRKQGRRS